MVYVTLRDRGHRVRIDAGLHIDLVLPGDRIRQYSLCGDRWDAHTYQIAILRQATGRGGSVYIHDELRVGDRLRTGGPRNNFAMVPAQRYLFVAGGIGITPLLPMIHQAKVLGVEWSLLYGGRSTRSMAFLHSYRSTATGSPSGLTTNTDRWTWRRHWSRSLPAPRCTAADRRPPGRGRETWQGLAHGQHSR
jgi:ferredoxin-NADP reductase